jgi:hypothetical protein
MFGEIITYETSNLEIFSVPLLLPASPPRIPPALFSNIYFIVSYIMARDFLTFIFTHNRRQNYIFYILIFCIVQRSLYTKQYSYNKFVVSILLCYAYNLPDNGLVEAETCRRDIVNNKLVCIIYCADYWLKYCVFSLVHGSWTTFDLKTTPSWRFYVVGENKPYLGHSVISRYFSPPNFDFVGRF